MDKCFKCGEQMYNNTMRMMCYDCIEFYIHEDNR